MRLDEIMQQHSDNLASNTTLSLPRLKTIMRNSGLNGDDILYIDDIETLRPSGSVLRVSCAYHQEMPTANDPEGVIGHTNVILSRDQNNQWVAKVDRRDTQPTERRNPKPTNMQQSTNPYVGSLDRRNKMSNRRSV